MNGPDIAKMSAGGVSGSEGKDLVANGHAENESNPFAEYMWMENEEEYNRQVCTHPLPHSVQLEMNLTLISICLYPRWRRNCLSKSFWSDVSKRC